MVKTNIVQSKKEASMVDILQLVVKLKLIDTLKLVEVVVNYFRN